MLSGVPFRVRSRLRRGTAAVELAVALPVLVLLAGTVVDVGIMLSTTIRLQNAVETGALYGAQGNRFTSDTDGIRSAVTQDAGNVEQLTVTTRRVCRCPADVAGTIETAEVNCTTTCSIGAYGPPRVYVEVAATGSAKLLVLHNLIPGGWRISRMSTFRSQ